MLFTFPCKPDKSQNGPGFLSVSHAYNFSRVSSIPVPGGYKRVEVADGSFAGWLRDIPFKNDNRVFLYNGELKRNQSVQFAVLDIPVGKKDLQQCADAIMRLRAEYFYGKKEFYKISFTDYHSKIYKWQGGEDRAGFEKYLENVFVWCGSASLEKQLKPVPDFNRIMPGDVLIKGGFPGHAMIVMDVAVNNYGHKIYMLAQSYMPAQDIHIVKNPGDTRLSPWYAVNDKIEIITPEYQFHRNQLRTW
jgi:hypothetical protein